MDSVQAMNVLNVDGNATPKQIKSAYRKLVLEHHPDKKHDDGRQFREITEAYHTLIDKKPADKQAQTTTHETAQTSSRAKWGAGPTDKVPEEDWSRYTQEFEQDDSWWKEYERRFWNEYDRHVHGRETGDESEKAREPEEQPNLRVEVDQSLCIGCCSCETIAPDVFELNRNAKSNPKSRVKNPKGAGVNRIMNAAETCPTKAIQVDNLITGEKMYPF